MNEMFLGVSRVWCAEPKDKGLLGGGGMVPEVSRVTYSLLVTLPTPGHHHGKCINTLSPKVRHSGEGVKLAIILSLKTLVSEVSDQLNILPLKRRAQCDKADIEPVLKGIGKTWL